MKKIISVILLILLMLSATFSLSAVELPEAPSVAKLDEKLKLKVEELSEEDIVGIWVWFTHGLTGTDIDNLTIEKYGPEIKDFSVNYDDYETVQEARAAEREKVHRWRNARIEISKEFYTTNNERILDELGILDSERDFVSMLSPVAILYVPVYTAISIAEHPEVASVYYYEEEVATPDEPPMDPPTEPPTEKPSETPSASSDEVKFYETDEFKRKFMSFCSPYKEYSPEKVLIWDAKEIGDVLVFTGDLTEGSQVPLDGHYEILGDWVVNNYGYYVYGDGLCLYAYDGDKFYTIKEAWDKGIVSDLSEVDYFAKPIYVTRIGDANRDRKIDIKDVTAIQKHIAGLETLEVYSGFRCIYDFNRDIDINIKDATAIQKHIAGLE